MDFFGTLFLQILYSVQTALTAYKKMIVIDNCFDCLSLTVQADQQLAVLAIKPYLCTLLHITDTAGCKPVVHRTNFR